ncbi:uncharacterized protein LY89DRAFT_729321 [Mollisia scopiformis]|uniref:Uncharacterized protein n=1 Tax=Mollisia scopiformis TaxID=149040 RepID=A0A194XNT5_MOLSC|nr:uncharacterized protein LY89DRAFT_729321 [Mollisia scopiformis]KUJ21821.1 hypothetical protein LY89DRAFT_729321 [Mollisia scopiformis]
MATESPNLQAPDYSHTLSGFFHIYSHRKFLGFVADVEDCNRVLLTTHGRVSQREMEELYTSEVIRLYHEWCSDPRKGGGLPEERRVPFLSRAFKLMTSSEAYAYWDFKRAEDIRAKAQGTLIFDSVIRVAVREENARQESLEKTPINGSNKKSET